MKNEMLPEFENTCSELQHVINSINEQELNVVPFEGSWTAAQVADHVLKSQSMLMGLLYGKTKSTERDPLEKVKVVKEIFLNFTTKMTSPEMILPSNTALDKGELLGSLKTTYDKIMNAIQTLELSETCLEFVLPNIGEMTRAEWIYFIIYHTQRHIHQLKNISEKLIADTVS